MTKHHLEEGLGPKGAAIEWVADRRVVIVSWVEGGKECKNEYTLAAWVELNRLVDIDIAETLAEKSDDEQAKS